MFAKISNLLQPIRPMLPSPKRAISFGVLAFFAVWSSAVAVFAGPPNVCEDTYTTAVRFMRVFYPELSNKGANLDMEARYPFDADGPLLSFYLRVSESDQAGRIVAAPSPNPSSADRLGHLIAHFQFDGRDTRIFYIFFSGSLVNAGKSEAIDKIVDEHPEWSEAQMTDALLRAGAKFGPSQKDQLLASFPMKELEPIVGKTQWGQAQFTFRGNTEPPFYAVMDWSIRFWAQKDGKRDEYTVAVEPFNGKVTSIGRRSLN